MPSLFSRSRTTSTPKKSSETAAYDEFGRIDSRGSARTLLSPHGKKDKKKESKNKSGAKADPFAEAEPPEYAIPDGTFLSLNLNPPRIEITGDSPGTELRQSHDYGYLSYGRHVVLGLQQVARLVDVVGNELGLRGLTTPFIFSTLALDVSSGAVRRLIQAFLRTCSQPSGETEHQWREEARLAGPQELGMCLRWGLARVVRIMKGQEVRGLVPYESYVEWRDAEAALNYPETHFATFIAPLEPLLQSILVGLLTLLTRFTAHSASSGHTPPTLSPLFAPLLFGLGPSTLAFHQVYMHYLRATTATEHLILSFIRWQNVPSTSANGAGLASVPTRLKAWIQGYPAMLPAIGKPDRRPQPRRGARTVRLVSVRRNVRMYSPDLVKTAASWAHRYRGGGVSSGMGERAFAGSKEWERVVPPTLKLPPRYSDGYKKRMDLPPHFHPDTGTSSSSSALSVPSLSSSVSTSSTGTSSIFDDKEHGILIAGTNDDRFRSLTDMKWGEFEVMGFGNLGADEKKLQFDLTEGARAARAAKRATLTWQDFSSCGFSRTDAPLNATLQFSTPVTNSVNAWPTHSVEIHRKLKKTQKSLPAFGWDIEPVLGAEELIEEAFVDVFCDLVYGGGWMDIERCEEIDRECNWALVEFKSMPISRPNTVSSTSDPRTSNALFLFEEFVPLEYRQQLASSERSRRRLPSIFGTSSKSKQWKPATTLNGRPYVVGHVPSSPSYREVEFEGLLRENGSATKIISLSPSRGADGQSPVPSNVATSGHAETPTTKGNGMHLLPPSLRLDTRASSPTLRTPKREGNDSPAPAHRRQSRFRLPTGLPVSPGASRRSGLIPAEYESVDFDARLASFSDDDLSMSRDKWRRSRDDAWVDILVANNNRRMQDQDADPRSGQRLRSRRSDPELASQEVSEVLAAVQRQYLSDEEDEIEPVEPPSEDNRLGNDHDDSMTIEGSVADRDGVSLPERESALYGDDEDEDPVQPPRGKRLGYFDLHPDRRPLRQERKSLDSDAFSQDETYSDMVPSSSARPQRDSVVSSLYPSEGEGESEATPNPSLADVTNTSHGSASSPPPLQSISNIPTTVGLRPTFPNGPSLAASPGTKQVTSKTASLIELYRERERNAEKPGTTPPQIPASASRLPVRTASLPQQGTEAQPTLLPAKKLHPSAAPAPPPASETEESDVESFLALEEIEPNVPNRYVHGAPLHNVLEEPEEEE